MSLFLGQIKQVFRRLRRAPLFSAVTFVTIAIAIGANTVVFSVVEGVLLKPLNYPESDRLIGVWYKAPAINIPKLSMAAYLYFIDREQSRTLEDIGLYNNSSFGVTGGAQPEELHGLQVTESTLPLLGVQPAHGRLFAARDDTPNSPKTVVLSYVYWQRHFGGDPAAVGRTLMVDGNASEIIGILPKGFHFLDRYDLDLFVPLRLDRSKTTLGNFSFNGLAKLKPGVTLEQADADLERLVPVANRSFPPPQGFSAVLFEKAHLAADLHPLKSDVVGDVGNVLWVLMGSIAIMLLVACANVANLLLVRIESRRQELAIRSALGADRKHITAGLLLECLVLGCTGSAIGLVLAFATLRVLVAKAPMELPRLHEIGIDVPVLFFTLGLALFVSLVIGSIPVLKYSGIRASTGLREGRGLSDSRERHRARKVLVIVQVALALVLLICSGLMIRTFHALVQVSPGFIDPNTLQTFAVFIPPTQIPDTDRARVLRTEQAIADQLAAIPGVSSVAITTQVPMSGSRNFNPVYARDRVYKEGELAPMRRIKFVSPGFFSTMGTPLVAGRDLTWAEEYEKRPVTIISESFAREYWGSPAAAIGKFVHVGSTDPWHEVIGVAGDVYDDGVSQDPPSAIYLPLFQDNYITEKELVMRYASYVIRSPRAGSASFMNQVQSAEWSIDRDLPLDNPTTLGILYTKSMARTSFTLVMLCVAGGMTLLLGIVGLYGVIAYAISQRTREIGIRMALGAQREALTGMFVRQGITLAGIGALCGVSVAFATMRLMRSLLYHVSPMDPWTYSAATVSILAVAWLATYLPSRRAAVIDPVHALRAE